MRVILVTPIDDPEEHLKDAPRPQVGDIDCVIHEAMKYGKSYYLLERFGPALGYAVEHFAILSDQPEEVIEEQELIEA